MNTGELRLRLKNVNGRMLFEESYVRGAFKLGKPVWQGGIPLYYLLHIGGGYVSGDTYTQQIELLENTRLYLTTQAATKVYKGTIPAVVSTNIKLGEHSHLSLLQDPLILYEHATFHQTTTIELAKTSTLYYSEIITPGWSPSKELFTYKELYTEMAIRRDGKLFYLDRLSWQKGQQQLLQLGDYTHYGTLICIEQLPETFYDQLHDITHPHCEMGYSQLNKAGFVLKIAAKETQHIENIFQRIHDLLTLTKHEQPLRLRKY